MRTSGPLHERIAAVLRGPDVDNRRVLWRLRPSSRVDRVVGELNGESAVLRIRRVLHCLDEAQGESATRGRIIDPDLAHAITDAQTLLRELAGEPRHNRL